MNWWDENVVPVILRPETASSTGAFLGFLGAPGSTWRERLFNLLSGIAVAVYVAPFVAERMQIQSKTGLIAFSFCAGLVGMNLVSKAITWSKNADLPTLVSLFTTKGRAAARADRTRTPK